MDLSVLTLKQTSLPDAFLPATAFLVVTLPPSVIAFLAFPGAEQPAEVFRNRGKWVFLGTLLVYFALIYLPSHWDRIVGAEDLTAGVFWTGFGAVLMLFFATAGTLLAAPVLTWLVSDLFAADPMESGAAKLEGPCGHDPALLTTVSVSVSRYRMAAG